jgi:hypothetical protein
MGLLRTYLLWPLWRYVRQRRTVGEAFVCPKCKERLPSKSIHLEEWTIWILVPLWRRSLGFNGIQCSKCQTTWPEQVLGLAEDSNNMSAAAEVVGYDG